MQATATAPAGPAQDEGLVLARRQITAARERGTTPSDGGSSGRTDTND